MSRAQNLNLDQDPDQENSDPDQKGEVKKNINETKQGFKTQLDDMLQTAKRVLDLIDNDVVDNERLKNSHKNNFKNNIKRQFGHFLKEIGE